MSDHSKFYLFKTLMQSSSLNNAPDTQNKHFPTQFYYCALNKRALFNEELQYKHTQQTNKDLPLLLF